MSGPIDLDDINECGGCGGNFFIDDLRDDDDGVPLCESCFDEFSRSDD